MSSRPVVEPFPGTPSVKLFALDASFWTSRGGADAVDQGAEPPSGRLREGAELREGGDELASPVARSGAGAVPAPPRSPTAANHLTALISWRITLGASENEIIMLP